MLPTAAQAIWVSLIPKDPTCDIYSNYAEQIFVTIYGREKEKERGREEENFLTSLCQCGTSPVSSISVMMTYVFVLAQLMSSTQFYSQRLSQPVVLFLHIGII